MKEPAPQELGEILGHTLAEGNAPIGVAGIKHVGQEAHLLGLGESDRFDVFQEFSQLHTHAAVYGLSEASQWFYIGGFTGPFIQPVKYGKPVANGFKPFRVDTMTPNPTPVLWDGEQSAYYALMSGKEIPYVQGLAVHVDSTQPREKTFI